MTTPAQLVTPPDTAMMRAGIAEVLRSEPENHMALDLKWALDRIAELEAENDRFRKALTELTTLGNGERLGNSDGNMIARRALGL